MTKDVSARSTKKLFGSPEVKGTLVKIPAVPHFANTKSRLASYIHLKVLHITVDFANFMAFFCSIKWQM